MFVSHGGLSPAARIIKEPDPAPTSRSVPPPPPFDSPLPCYNTATLSTALLARCAGSIHSQRFNRLPFHSVGTGKRQRGRDGELYEDSASIAWFNNLSNEPV